MAGFKVQLHLYGVKLEERGEFQAHIEPNYVQHKFPFLMSEQKQGRERSSSAFFLLCLKQEGNRQPISLLLSGTQKTIPRGITPGIMNRWPMGQWYDT